MSRPLSQDVQTEVDRILKQLEKGPVKSFGSKRTTDRALQRLRVDGRIRYRSAKLGGCGWELVK